LDLNLSRKNLKNEFSIFLSFKYYYHDRHQATRTQNARKKKKYRLEKICERDL